MHNKLKLIIFDLDGTLINAYPAITESINDTLKQLGYKKISHSRIKRAVGWGDDNLLARFIADQDDLKKAIDIFRKEHVKVLRKKVKFMPGAKRLLDRVKKKYKLAIASNRSTETSLMILKRLGIFSYFDYIICGDKLQKLKPHPAVLLNVLKKFSLKPNQTIYVGDMAIDIQAGRRAKIKTVAVATGSSSKAALKREKPFAVISDIYSFIKILNGHQI